MENFAQHKVRVTHFLCLHGNFGAPADWGRVSALLAEQIHGASFDTPNLWTVSGTDSVEELARTVSVAKGRGKKVVAIGYSLGARLILELLARKDVALDGVVLCSVNPGLTDPAARRDRLATDSKWAERLTNLQIPWEQLLAEWNSQAVFAGSAPNAGQTFTSPDDERIVRTSIARRFREWSLGALPPRWSTLETAKCPVLCVAGELDTKFRLILESIERLRNPRIECGVIPGAGHRVGADRPEVLAGRIALFINKAGKPVKSI